MKAATAQNVIVKIAPRVIVLVTNAIVKNAVAVTAKFIKGRQGSAFYFFA